MNFDIGPDLQGEKGDGILEVGQEDEIDRVLEIEGHVLGSIDIDIEDIDPDIKFQFFLYLYFYYFIFILF